MVTIAEPLPIGSRVQKPTDWNSEAIYTGTTQSDIYKIPGKTGWYVDVLWDHKQRVEVACLNRIVKVRTTDA